ncbi:hypothetical protein [Brevundimonas sp. Root1279]|uniref:hypothetical protein n=1 Tax=Brevundimonas sp. Root1279 TaxID=1736443 RepID=UPI0006F7956C|nr:hypothetical protein [Brevundimonas sp. Root1279]KQW83125.1 hypothetical protein ASC65_07280 [Brevundimonas sp. Root1279]
MGHKGLRLTEKDAQAIAEAYVASLDLKGWRYEAGDVHDASMSLTGEYTVVFDTYSPEGTLVDGAVAVFVNKATGKARMFDGSM